MAVWLLRRVLRGDGVKLRLMGRVSLRRVSRKFRVVKRLLIMMVRWMRILKYVFNVLMIFTICRVVMVMGYCLITILNLC